MLREKTNCAFAAHNRVVDVVADCIAGDEISRRITDSIAMPLQLVSNRISVRQIVAGAGREEHIVVHVFAETFVAVERMEVPPRVQLDSQTIDDDGSGQQGYKNAGDRGQADSQSCPINCCVLCCFRRGIGAKLLRSNLFDVLAEQARRRVAENFLRESVCDGAEPTGHPLIVARTVPRIVGEVQLRGRDIYRQQCRSQRRETVAEEVHDRYFADFFPVFDAANAAVADVQNGRVDEVVAMFQTAKKRIVGEIQFVLRTTVRQLRQLVWKGREVPAGTVDVQSGVVRPTDTDTTCWTAFGQLTHKQTEIYVEAVYNAGLSRHWIGEVTCHSSEYTDVQILPCDPVVKMIIGAITSNVVAINHHQEI